MNEPQNTSGPQFRADRPLEQEAVRTTIVGGRPPGSGKQLGEIPRGIEVLVKKASVDADFKHLLIEHREVAAEAIGLKLDPSEVLMLRAAAAEQLEAVIAQTRVPAEHRRAFLGTAAALMLAAIGVVGSGCNPEPDPVTGIRPDEPDWPPPEGMRPDRPDPRTKVVGIRPSHKANQEIQPDRPPEPSPEDGNEAGGPEPPPEPEPSRPDRVPVTDGIRPDQVPTTKGIRPDRPPAPTGIRPDLPPPAPGSKAE